MTLGHWEAFIHLIIKYLLRAFSLPLLVLQVGINNKKRVRAPALGGDCCSGEYNEENYIGRSAVMKAIKQRDERDTVVGEQPLTRCAETLLLRYLWVEIWVKSVSVGGAGWWCWWWWWLEMSQSRQTYIAHEKSSQGSLKIIKAVKVARV